MGPGRRHELTDAVRAVFVLIIPERPIRLGRPWADHRTVINGVLRVLTTGAPSARHARAVWPQAGAIRALCALDRWRDVGVRAHSAPGRDAETAPA